MQPSNPPDNQDLTALSGSTTDVAPLGRGPEKPEHEKTAAEDAQYPWDEISKLPEFHALVGKKMRFIIPTCIFFCVYYFALPVLVGYFPEVMKGRIGPVNLAYVFALSQFFMAWIIAAIYVKVAAGWDISSAAIIEKSTGESASKPKKS